MLSGPMAALSPAALSDARILAAYIIFLASYVVFALGKFPGLKIDRTGAAIIGGLYWKRGTTAGAWCGVLSGSLLAVLGILLTQNWSDVREKGRGVPSVESCLREKRKTATEH